MESIDCALELGYNPVKVSDFMLLKLMTDFSLQASFSSLLGSRASSYGLLYSPLAPEKHLVWDPTRELARSVMTDL